MASYIPGPSRKAFLMDYYICCYCHKQIKKPACFFNLGSSSLSLETSVLFSDLSILRTHCFCDGMWQLLSFARQCSTSDLFFWNWGQQRWLALLVMKMRLNLYMYFDPCRGSCSQCCELQMQWQIFWWGGRQVLHVNFTRWLFLCALRAVLQKCLMNPPINGSDPFYRRMSCVKAVTLPCASPSLSSALSPMCVWGSFSFISSVMSTLGLLWGMDDSCFCKCCPHPLAPAPSAESK